jgi:hypothetical protein
MAAPTPATQMTAVEFFEHPTVQFPLERSDEDFEGFVEKKLNDYVSLIRDMNPGDNITTSIKREANKIDELCNLIRNAIHDYLRGLPHVAYARLDAGIRVIGAEFRRLISENVDHSSMCELYRMRLESQPGATFTKGDLFHIPFQLRHKVKRQRYSIPGLPCLYLGGSLYICWEELRRPSFESIHVARFQPAPGQTISILNFEQRPPHTAQFIRGNVPNANEHPTLRAGYCALAVCWPLMATTSIRRKHGDSPFIVEYIVPQLILQWITENNDPDLDGIAYSSVSCKTHVASPPIIGNFVFPAKEIGSSGYCPRLLRKLAMTTPVAWNVLARVEYPATMPSYDLEIVEFVPGLQVHYSRSEFCTVEGKLRRFPAAVLP